MRIPTLETGRLLIREFVLDDLEAVHHLLDGTPVAATEKRTGTAAPDEQAQWLQWTVLGYGELARLHQPPYGDRALVSRTTGELIGACGFVPMVDRFAQIPGFTSDTSAGMAPSLNSPEVGLHWVVLPQHRRRGYATEAGKALTRHAFAVLQLQRIVATTTYDNMASMGVMRKLGMRLERNPSGEPPWLQVVGVLSIPRPDPSPGSA